MTENTSSYTILLKRKSGVGLILFATFIYLFGNFLNVDDSLMDSVYLLLVVIAFIYY